MKRQEENEKKVERLRNRGKKMVRVSEKRCRNEDIGLIKDKIGVIFKLMEMNLSYS